MKDYNPEELYDEFLKMQQLKFLVDHTAFMIMTRPLTQEYIQILLKETHDKVLELFPDKEDTYNLIYGSRFKRLIEEFQNLNG